MQELRIGDLTNYGKIEAITMAGHYKIEGKTEIVGSFQNIFKIHTAEDKSDLKGLISIRKLILIEIMKTKVKHDSEEFKAMNKQLEAVNVMIRILQLNGYQPTTWEKIKAFLKRLKMRLNFTLFTNH